MTFISVEFETGADYSDDEKEELLSVFQTFIGEIDDDADINSVEIFAATEAERKAAELTKFAEMLETHDIKATITVHLPNGTEHFATDMVEVESEDEDEHYSS